MANVAGGGGGHTGPYWRRQLGMTLPGERTGQQLALLNAARAAQGLPPVGGEVGDDTRVAMAQNPQLDLEQLHGLQPPQGFEADRTFGQGMDEFGGQYHDEDMAHQQPGAMQSDHDLATLREQLLHRVLGGVAPTSREALLQHRGQTNLRQAHAARRQHPILPQRPGVRAAHAKRSY